MQLQLGRPAGETFAFNAAMSSCESFNSVASMSCLRNTGLLALTTNVRFILCCRSQARATCAPVRLYLAPTFSQSASLTRPEQEIVKYKVVNKVANKAVSTQYQVQSSSPASACQSSTQWYTVVHSSSQASACQRRIRLNDNLPARTERGQALRISTHACVQLDLVHSWHDAGASCA